MSSVKNRCDNEIFTIHVYSGTDFENNYNRRKSSVIREIAGRIRDSFANVENRRKGRSQNEIVYGTSGTFKEISERPDLQQATDTQR